MVLPDSEKFCDHRLCCPWLCGRVSRNRWLS